MQPDEGGNGGHNDRSTADQDQETHDMPSSAAEAASKFLSISNVAYIIACAFAVLATFGIVYFSTKYTRLKEAELDEYKHQADRRIEEAKAKAAGANALAEAARADAESARADQEKFKAERAQWEAKIASMEQSHSKLMQTSQTTQQELDKLKDATRARTITPDQQKKIADLLRPFAGKAVSIRLYASETEAQIFAGQVAATLGMAGLHPEVVVMLGTPGWGFGIAVHDAKSAPLVAATIQHAFRAAGLELDGLELPEQVPAGEYFIIVGVKTKPTGQG